MSDFQTAIDVCTGAIRNNARITAIIATDEAESERSVHFGFSVEESRKLLTEALKLLKDRE